MIAAFCIHPFCGTLMNVATSFLSKCRSQLCDQIQQFFTILAYITHILHLIGNTCTFVCITSFHTRVKSCNCFPPIFNLPTPTPCKSPTQTMPLYNAALFYVTYGTAASASKGKMRGSLRG